MAGNDASPVVAAALAGGADLVQLRDKGMADAELVRQGERLRELCQAHGALFLLNDSPDLALACGADGVHVGQDDQPTESVRAVVGDDILVGLSTHSPDQFDAGLLSAADYLCAGPVWETPTKPGRPATGLALVEHARRRRAPKPFFAIGGIDSSNVERVARAGAERVVVVRAIRDAADPRAAAATLRGALERAGKAHAA